MTDATNNLSLSVESGSYSFMVHESPGENPLGGFATIANGLGPWLQPSDIVRRSETQANTLFFRKFRM